jgi:two-component system, chemotaxis family, chemotaxis protein CheY
MRVLVVDDSSTMRRIIVNALKKLGYEDTLEAGDGREALKCLETSHADLIVTDWNMPEMTGPQFVEALRALPAHAKVPVLMVTTQAAQEDVIIALRAGVNDYLIKPFTPDALKDRLQSLLAKV